MLVLAMPDGQEYCAVQYVPNGLMNGDVGGQWWPNVHMSHFILLPVRASKLPKLACILVALHSA